MLFPINQFNMASNTSVYEEDYYHRLIRRLVPDLKATPEEITFYWKIYFAAQIIVLVYAIVGVIGNVFSFAVLCRKSYRRSSTAVYLRALVIIDVFILLLHCFGGFFSLVIVANRIICFLFDYLEIVFLNLSNWMLVVVTGERIIAILLPHRANQLLTVKKAYILVVCVVCAMFILDAHDIILMDFATWDMCFLAFPHEPTKSVIKVFKIINTIKYLIIPAPFITIGNIIIILNLRKQNKIMKEALSGDYKFRFANISEIKSELTTEQDSDMSSQQPHTQQQQQQPAKMKKRETLNSYPPPKSQGIASKKMDVMVMRKQREKSLVFNLLALNFCFLLTRVPIESYNIVIGLPPSYLNLHKWTIKLILGIVSLLNNTVNFFLYLATGSRFRREFKAMMSELWAFLATRSPVNCSSCQKTMEP